LAVSLIDALAFVGAGSGVFPAPAEAAFEIELPPPVNPLITSPIDLATLEPPAATAAPPVATAAPAAAAAMTAPTMSPLPKLADPFAKDAAIESDLWVRNRIIRKPNEIDTNFSRMSVVDPNAAMLLGSFRFIAY
jgi:hypothetical protein